MRRVHRGLWIAVLSAFAALVIAGTAIAEKSGTYTGSTTQTGQPGGTVRFSVTKNGKTVKAFSGDIWSTCTKHGASQTVHITLNPVVDMTIHKGKFGFHGNFNINNGPVVIAKHVAGRISGKFGAKHTATGKMSFTWKFDNSAPAGFQGDSCTTGTAKFSAKHK